MPPPAQTFSRAAQTVGGTGAFLDLMDAIYTLFNTNNTKWEIKNAVGSAGSYEAFNVGPVAGAPLQNMRVCLAGKASGSPIVQSPDTNLASALLCAMTKDGSGGFDNANWNDGTNPWTAGPGMIGFNRVTAASTTFQEVIRYDSADSFFLYTRLADNATFGAVYVGGIFAHFVDAEGETGLSGRCYGMITSGSGGVSSSFASSSAALTSHSATANQAHVYMLKPNTSTVLTLDRVYNVFSSSAYVDQSELANRVYTSPFVYQKTASTVYNQGYLRDLKLGKGIQKTKIDVTGTDTYLVFGASAITNADALMFPMT